MDWESLLPTLPESIDTSQDSLEQNGHGTAVYMTQYVHVEPISVATHAEADDFYMPCS